MTANPQQRKEIVGAMLKGGLFDPLGAMEHQAAATTAPNERPYAELVPIPQPASMCFLAQADSSPPPNASTGVGKDLVDAVRRGDVRGKDQKDLVANMLKTGLFCAPPGPILATSADECAMDLDLNPSSVTEKYAEESTLKKSVVDPFGTPSRSLKKYAQETAMRGKL